MGERTTSEGRERRLLGLRAAGPVRVGLFSPRMGGGGAEKTFKRLAVGFSHAGLAVDVVVARGDGPNLIGLPSAVRVVDLGCRRVLSCAGPLAHYLNVERPDVLISTLAYANVVAVWARAMAKVAPQLILREANTLSIASSGSSDARDRALPLLARAFYPRADAVVAVSKGVAEDLINNVGISRSLVRVIYNPTFDSDILSLAREPVNHPWFGDGGPPVLLSVGRLTPQKRFDTLIRAVSIARRHRPLRVVVLGEGEDKGRLESLTRELGLGDCVSLPGFVSNPYAYMARADLYVVSSAWEGFPNTVVEAMACGLSVVSTDCPSGPREILAAPGPGTGRLGTLVPVDDPEKLSEAILLELDLDRDRAGFQRRARQFASERAVRSYIDLMCVGLNR